MMMSPRLVAAQCVLCIAMSVSCRDPESPKEPSAGREPEVNHADSGTPHLELSLEGTEDRPILIMELMNGGHTPITIDKELVLLVSIQITGVGGDTIELEWCDDGGKSSPRASDWHARFIELAPGESAKRRISLKDCFAVYSNGSRFSHTPGFKKPPVELIHLNHYFFRTGKFYYEVKVPRREIYEKGRRPQEYHEQSIAIHNTVTDNVMLQYVPRLKKRLNTPGVPK